MTLKFELERIATALEKTNLYLEAILCQSTAQLLHDISVEGGDVDPPRTKMIVMAESFIRTQLRLNGDKLPWTEIVRLGAQHGFTANSLRRVRDNVAYARKDSRDGRFYWYPKLSPSQESLDTA